MTKHHERRAVEALLSWLPYSDRAIEDWQRESPDALIRLNGRIVGVEVTRVEPDRPPSSVPLQAWTTEAKRVVKSAQKLFEERHSQRLVVSVEFRHDWRPARRDAKTLAEDLALLVANCAAQLDADSSWARGTVTVHDPHRAVSRLYVGETEQYLGGQWEPSLGFSKRPASAEEIWKTVRRKETLLETYRQAAPDVWLIIDCNVCGLDIALDVPTAGFLLNTGFDRVFCCGFGFGSWVEIPAIHPSH